VYKINSINIPVTSELDKSHIAKKLNIKEKDIKDYIILKKAIDARKKNDVRFVYSVAVDTERKINGLEEYTKIEYIFPKGKKLDKRPVIVGMGPCGLFAGLMLAKAGYCPIILERGADVDTRLKKVEQFWDNGILRFTNPNDHIEWALIGPKDMKTATGLIHLGPEHRKFMRQIMVTVDITAPLYWWKEFDTYKIGTTANSTSTMHKMLAKPITLDCFEIGDFTNLPYPVEMQREEIKSPCDTDFVQMCLIPYLEYLRQTAINCKDAGDEETQKIYWKELIRWLPESWLQTRTVTMNYENLRTMYHQRKNHKLVEWNTDFINFIKSLPYADEFIIN